MTTLSAGMERFLELLGGRVSMTKWDAAEKAAELIRAYEEERRAVQEFESMDFPPDETRARLSLAQITLHNLKSEIEKE